MACLPRLWRASLDYWRTSLDYDVQKVLLNLTSESETVSSLFLSFAHTQFDAAAFVASTRSLVPLERLRDDLQDHLRDRKQVCVCVCVCVCIY